MDAFDPFLEQDELENLLPAEPVEMVQLLEPAGLGFGAAYSQAVYNNQISPPALFLLHDLVLEFYADPVAAFEANRDFYLAFPRQFPGWYFAAPGATTQAIAMEANPLFFQRHPGALNPMAGGEVLFDDAFNPWIPVPGRRIRRHRHRRGQSVETKPAEEVLPTDKVPWSPPVVPSPRYYRKHYVFRKGGRGNLLKHCLARKCGDYNFGSYGAGSLQA